MAKSRKRWAHLRKYWFKKGKKRRARRRKTTHKRKASHMARKRRGRRRYTKRRHHSHRRRGRRRSHGMGGGGRGVAAIKHDMPLMVAAAIYGLAESKAKADSNFVLNKLPKPVTQLGFAGNTALALYLATMVTPNKWVRLGARAVAMVATYQLGKNGGAFTSGTQILGELDDGQDERVIDAHVMGALEAEGNGSGRQQGLTYDTVVREAGGRV